jgi:hypothetical protein
MLKMIFGVCVLFLIASSARAQLMIGDSQMDAWRQMRGFGLHFDSVVENGKVKIYHADSIRIAKLLNKVTVHLDDSQRVQTMVFEARDIDTATFAEKYELMLKSPKVTRRFDDGNTVSLHLEHAAYVVDLMYDRRLGTIVEIDSKRQSK